MVSVYQFHSTNLCEHILCAMCTASSSTMSPSQPCRPCSLQQAFTEVQVALGLWAWTPPGGLPPSSLQSSSWNWRHTTLYLWILIYGGDWGYYPSNKNVTSHQRGQPYHAGPQGKPEAVGLQYRKSQTHGELPCGVLWESTGHLGGVDRISWSK